MFLKILLTFCLIEIVEIQVISIIYDLISVYLNTQIAFFLTWGEIFFTFFFALKLIKTIGPQALQNLIINQNKTQNVHQTIQRSFDLMLSAFCLLLPGYLSDTVGLLILSQNKKQSLHHSSFNIATLLKKIILGNPTTQKNTHVHYQFYSQYSHKQAKDDHDDSSQPLSPHQEIIDVEPINDTQATKVNKKQEPRK